jgi:hypothetical protein
MVNTAVRALRRQRRAPRRQRGGRVPERALVGQQPRDDQLSRLRACQRLSDRQQLIELDLVGGKSEHCAVRFATSTRSSERILGQDRALELTQPRCGLDPELLHERFPRAPIHVERLRLSARSIEGQHQLRAKGLTRRLLASKLLELADELPIAAEREIRLDSMLERCEPDLLEALDRGLGE